uniref:Endothelial differentiation-related factor 1 n=1 Tax=Caligus clemensi TaxID=344056 RepID=C1C215_CALCM|nr:Endothelial differentiation-related factor 1 [Caligus clemensi]
MGDWDTVTVIRGRQSRPGAAKSNAAINAARRRGEAVNTELKYGAGMNKHSSSTLNTAKLDAEVEELRHEKVPLSIGKLIQQGRQAKGLTQKDLATKICEKIQVVNEYESGKAVVPNQAILGKMERALDMKLRGKDKGAPLGPKPKKAQGK